MRFYIPALIVLIIISNIKLYSQCACCSAAFSGSALAAGTSNVGVLKEGSIRAINVYRFLYGNNFYRGIESLDNLYGESLNIHFLGTNIGYGLTKDITVDFEIGSFPAKNLDYGYTNDKISGLGVATLIGKWNFFNDRNTKQEATLGIGYRQPITENLILSGTSGIVAQLFYFLNIHEDVNLILFIRGEKSLENSNNYSQGDNVVSSIFASTILADKLAGILELRYDYLSKAKDDTSDLLNTGRGTFYLVPQLNYAFDGFSLSTFFELPIHRNYNGVQLGERFGSGIALIFMI